MGVMARRLVKIIRRRSAWHIKVAPKRVVPAVSALDGCHNGQHQGKASGRKSHLTSKMFGEMRCLALLGGAFLLATVATAFPLASRRDRCTCLPAQWEGSLESRRRMLDTRTGHWRISENIWTVHYDYREHQRAAMLNKDGKSKIIADSSKGYTYMMNERGCHAVHTGVEVNRKCEPDSPGSKRYYKLPNGRQVVRWKHTGPANTSTRTIVALDNCMPVTQDVFSTHRGFIMLITSVYADVKRGIRDLGVFDVPEDCLVLTLDDFAVKKRFYRDSSSVDILEGSLWNTNDDILHSAEYTKVRCAQNLK